MFSSEYWYIGVLTLLLMTMEVIASLFLVKSKWATRIFLWIFAIYVVVTQAVELSETKVFSWALSTISYWLFVLGVICPVRPVKSACAVFAFMAGGGYMIGFLVKPEMLTHMGGFSIGYMQGFVIHNVLFVGSLLLLSQFRMRRYDMALAGGILAVIVLFTELGKYVFGWTMINGFLEGMVEASVLKTEYFPNLQLTWWWYILWYVALLALLWGIWELLCFVNRRLLRYSQPSCEKYVW